MFKLTTENNYMKFAKVEMFTEIIRIKEQFNLSNDELLAIIGSTLLSIGNDKKD